VQIWVANAGPPIPEKAMERLFQPFFRGEVRASQQGLGLGLHIASEIARAHGGSLVVHSDEAETRFTLTMPLV
jgi:sigma-B regulation protein RsbU (phosphoserine phosphatase)